MYTFNIYTICILFIYLLLLFMNLLMVYIFIALSRCTQFGVLNTPLNSEHSKKVASFVSVRLFPIFFPSYVGRFSFSWENKLWWWWHRTDVKHDAIIFLSSSLFQSTCICQTGVLFCCVSTFSLKRYTFTSNRRLSLWIPMWKHETDDFLLQGCLSKLHASNETPHMFTHSLTLQTSWHFVRTLLRFFAVDS